VVEEFGFEALCWAGEKSDGGFTISQLEETRSYPAHGGYGQQIAIGAVGESRSYSRVRYLCNMKHHSTCSPSRLFLALTTSRLHRVTVLRPNLHGRPKAKKAATPAAKEKRRPKLPPHDEPPRPHQTTNDGLSTCVTMCIPDPWLLLRLNESTCLAPNVSSREPAASGAVV
jgi:hypothetical protein